jgi:hypothetical protein
VMTEFPKTIGLIKARENSQWAIGDALIEECGESSTQGTINDGSRELIAVLAKELEELGLEGYTIGHLASLRNISSKFPANSRESALPWTFHRDAGSPEMLRKILERVTKQGKRITRIYITETRKAIEKEERETAIAKINETIKQAEMDEKIEDFIASVNKMMRTGQDISELIKENPEIKFPISAKFRKAIEASEQVTSRLAKEISYD